MSKDIVIIKKTLHGILRLLFPTYSLYNPIRIVLCNVNNKEVNTDFTNEYFVLMYYYNRILVDISY